MIYRSEVPRCWVCGARCMPPTLCECRGYPRRRDWRDVALRALWLGLWAVLVIGLVSLAVPR